MIYIAIQHTEVYTSLIDTVAVHVIKSRHDSATVHYTDTTSVMHDQNEVEYQDLIEAKSPRSIL